MLALLEFSQKDQYPVIKGVGYVASGARGL